MTAEAGGDYAFLDLGEPGFDLSDRGVDGRPAPPPVDVFVTTERGAYRPGETIFATILARDDRAAGGRRPAADRHRHPRRRGRVRPLPAARPGRRRAGAGAAARRRRADRRLAARGPRRPARRRRSRPRAFLVEDFVPERVDLDAHPARRPDRPRRAADARRRRPTSSRARPAPTSRSRARPASPWPATFPAVRASVFGLEDEPFTSGYAALAAGRPPTRPAPRRSRSPLPEAGPVSRPLDLTATLRARDGSGRPVERSETRPLLPGRAADRPPPALRRRGRRGRHRAASR